MNRKLLEKLNPKRGDKHEILFTQEGSKDRLKAFMFYNGISKGILNFNNYDYEVPNINISLNRLIFIKPII